MAERESKKSYLRDFERSGDGYVYKGKLWRADPALRRRTLARAWALQAVMLLCVLLPGFVTTAGLLNTFYVILPYVFWFLADIVLTYTLGAITFGGNPLRDYVYERNVARYVFRSRLALAGAALTALALLVFFVRDGSGDGGVVCLGCCLLQIAASVCAGRNGLSGLWTEEVR